MLTSRWKVGDVFCCAILYYLVFNTISNIIPSFSNFSEELKFKFSGVGIVGKNRALPDKSVKFGIRLGMNIRFPKTITNKLVSPPSGHYAVIQDGRHQK